MIPDDDASSYANFKASIKHIKGDRMVSKNPVLGTSHDDIFVYIPVSILLSHLLTGV